MVCFVYGFGHYAHYVLNTNIEIITLHAEAWTALLCPFVFIAMVIGSAMVLDSKPWKGVLMSIIVFHQIVIPFGLVSTVFYWLYVIETTDMSTSDWYFTVANHGTMMLLLLIDMLFS